jgi:hypothetical protein
VMGMIERYSICRRSDRACPGTTDQRAEFTV